MDNTKPKNYFVYLNDGTSQLNVCWPKTGIIKITQEDAFRFLKLIEGTKEYLEFLETQNLGSITAEIYKGDLPSFEICAEAHGITSDIDICPAKTDAKLLADIEEYETTETLKISKTGITFVIQYDDEDCYGEMFTNEIPAKFFQKILLL